MTNNNGRSSKSPNSRMILLLLILIICLLGLSFDYFTADYYDRSSSCGVNYIFVEATTSKNKKKKKKTNPITQHHHLVEFTLPHVPIHHDYDNDYDSGDENNKNIANVAKANAVVTAAIVPKIELEELNSFIEDATSYLIRINHSSTQDSKFPGRFTYITYTNQNLNHSLNNDNNYWNESKNYQKKYNLLRHNGAIYALSQAYFRKQKLQQKSKKHKKKKTIQHKNNEEEDNSINSDLILHTIKNGIGYLRDNALLSPPPGSKNNSDNNIVWLAAWERSDINDPQSVPTTAKLGGAGLALISLGSLYQIDSNQVSLKNELRPIGNFIESLQNIQDGSFTCKYQWSTGKDDSWQSLYYPGEAALGLVILAEIELKSENEIENSKQHEHERSYHWMQLASNTLLYLERYRRNQQLHQIEPDHWSLLATSKLLPLLDQQRKNVLSLQRKKQLDIEYWLIYNHGIKVATSMVSDHTTKQLITNNGCFSSDMRTCPTSTRLEGLCTYCI